MGLGGSLRLAAIALLAAVTAAVPACRETAAGIEDLRRFIRADSFVVPPDSACPVPARPSDRLREFAAASYEDDARVRAELAHYFLRYDEALLKRGLISVAYQSGDLVELLWNQEADICGGWFEESRSTLDMREWISVNTQRFELTAEAREQLKCSNEAFGRLRESGAIAIPKIRVAWETLSQAKDRQFDYEGCLLRAERGDSDAITQLLRFSDHVDAAGALGHGVVVVELLYLLGDAKMAACVRGESADIKRKIGSMLEAGEAYVQPPPSRPLREDYPETFVVLTLR